MGNCIASMPEGGRRRSDKVRSHKSVVPLNCEEEAHASSCTATERTASLTCSKPKRTVRFAGDPVGGGGADHRDEKIKCGGVRMKVVLTKKEAALLLSSLLAAEDSERTVKSIIRSSTAGKIEGGGCKLGSKEASCPLFMQVLPGYASFWRPGLETIPENF